MRSAAGSRRGAEGEDPCDGQEHPATLRSMGKLAEHGRKGGRREGTLGFRSRLLAVEYAVWGEDTRTH